MRRYYGVHETQFENYFREARASRDRPVRYFLQLLERRLDNVVYRLNLATSRAQARQLVTHRHFRVNGKLVNIPSFIVKPGDVISIGERSLKAPVLPGESRSRRRAPSPGWLELNAQEKSGKVVQLPSREQIDTPVDEQLIVEFYSR